MVDLVGKPTAPKEAVKEEVKTGVTVAPVLEFKRIKREVKLTVNKREGEWHPQPKEMRENVARISSTLTTVNGNPTGDYTRGLTPLEERLYLPVIVGMQPTDLGWQAKVREYWLEKTIKITDSRTLNASVTLVPKIVDGQEILLEEPDNILDYIDYRFCLVSNKVAKTEMEKAQSASFDVIMDDLAEVIKKEVDGLKIVDEADVMYSQLITEASSTAVQNQINWILSKIKEPSESFVGATPETKRIRLRKFKEVKPSEFVAELKNKNLEFEALIYDAINYQVISLEGKTYFFGDENLGTFAEAIEYVKNGNDPAKVGTIGKIKANLQLATQKSL